MDRDLAQHGLTRDKVLAAVVKLLELTRVRVGNDEYVKENGSYGLTTLCNEHVAVHAATLRFRFKGKSGVAHDVTLKNPRLARIVNACKELPGEELFQYLDDEGEPHGVDSSDVNDYLRARSGGDFSAKDFRTWSGTVHAALLLRAVPRGNNGKRTQKDIVRAIKETAAVLRNRPATCRKYYVHPAVLEEFQRGSLARSLTPSTRSAALAGLSPDECCLLRMLERAGAHARVNARAA